MNRTMTKDEYETWLKEHKHQKVNGKWIPLTAKYIIIQRADETVEVIER